MQRAQIEKIWAGSTDLSDKQQLSLALWLTGIEESMAWHERIVLDCLDLRRDESKWRIRVQGRRFANGKAGKAIVAWTDGASFYDALWKLSRDVARGEVVWKEDKYPVFDK